MYAASSSVARPADNRCGACIQLGWPCSPYCVFATCFPRNRPNKFAIIQRAFGTILVWNWLSRIPPNQRMLASEYLAWEASYRLRWWARNRPDYVHPPGQGTLLYPPGQGAHIYHNIRAPVVRMQLGAVADAILVPTPSVGNYFPGESSRTNMNNYFPGANSNGNSWSQF